MKNIFLWAIFFCGVVEGAQAADIAVYFSPNGGCERAVVYQIAHAARSIDIAMYFLSSYKIAKALVEARDRNVRVRIVLDQGQEIERGSKSTYLINHGFTIKYHNGFGLMHNKFAIMDDQVLITGSFNWTKTAEEKNEENLLVLDAPQTVGKYKDRFEYLWNTSRTDLRNAQGIQVVPSWFCTTFHVFC